MKRLLFILILLTASGASAYAQALKTCKANVDGGKYKVVSADHEVNQDGKPFLDLTVEFEKDKFNEADLLKVAQRIRETYCHENSINAFFVARAAKKMNLADVVPAPIFPLGTKCLYSLDRQKGAEKISFYDPYGKPTGEPAIEPGKH